MITPGNLTEVLNNVRAEDIETAFDSNNDYILLTVNGYGWVSLSCVPCTEDSEQEAESTGGVLCDKDAFLLLVSESSTTNIHLINLL